MNVHELVLRNRSYRRFDQSKAINVSLLEELVDLGRLSPSGANRQSQKYAVIAESTKNAEIFATLKWAGYLSDWDGPIEGEQPTGYIVVLQDKEVGPGMADHGIAVQSILLGAVEQGLGGCILGNIDRPTLAKLLHLPETLEILWVLALGVPKEEVVIEKMPADGSVKYWRDANGVHHVPKRSLDEVIAISIG